MTKETEEITLYPLDKTQPSRTVLVQKLSQKDLADLSQFSEGEEILAQKSAEVQARPAKLGDAVDTRPRVTYEGTAYTFSETKQTIGEKHVQNGAVIVTNPDGEEYVIASQEKFDKKYTPSKNGFVAVDGAKRFVRSNGNYALETSWGETQYILAGSYFCVENREDVYAITNSAFEATYQRVKKNQNKERQF